MLILVSGEDHRDARQARCATPTKRMTMTRDEKIQAVRAWWIKNYKRAGGATSGATMCAHELELPLNSVRGLQRDAFKGEQAPWQDGYVVAPAAPQAACGYTEVDGHLVATSAGAICRCPVCKAEAATHEEVASVFGFRKDFSGGRLRVRPHSYCKACKTANNKRKRAEKKEQHHGS